MTRTLAVVSAFLTFFATLPVAPVAHATLDNPWDLQAVDADGKATHPKVGASFSNPDNKVIVEGIALNAPDEMLDTSTQWQVYLQGEPPHSSGITAWAGTFYNSEWPRYPMDIQAGDRIRIEGFAMFRHGKTMLNERHSAAPELQMTVTIVEAGVGLPEPLLIPSIADCIGFDPTRATGGERYQNHWVRLDNVALAGGTWAAGETVTLTDASTETIPMLLSSQGAFDLEPSGPFSVLAIFNQEDSTEPFTEDYRLWVMKQDHILVSPSSVADWAMYE